MIKIVDLHHTYNIGQCQVQAVNSISLAIAKGEFVAITGPSGAGKSTLLHLIGGLQRFTSGEIAVDGLTLRTLSEKELAQYRNRRIGFIFQDFYLQKHLTAIENVALPLKIRGIPAREREQKAQSLLTEMGLADRHQHLPGELSGGERQRVAIARAIVTDPLLLLADEPTGNLDSATSKDILKLLIALNRERDLTLVMVTHNQEFAKMADRVVHIEDGQNRKIRNAI